MTVMNSFEYVKMREIEYHADKKAQVMAEDLLEKRAMAVGHIVGKKTSSSPYEGAQVALINEKTWVVIGPNMRWSGWIEYLSLDDLSCPIVITTNVVSKTALDRIMKSFVTIEGIHDLDLFLYQMEQINGNVVYPQ